jgi:transcriptional regulator with XRE-family HTH domain
MVLLRRVIGDALRARRQAQHRTLREVSTAANVSLGYLSEIERGQKEPSSELLSAVCEALGAQLSELLRDVSHTVEHAERGATPALNGADGFTQSNDAQPDTSRTASPEPASAAPAARARATTSATRTAASRTAPASRMVGRAARPNAPARSAVQAAPSAGPVKATGARPVVTTTVDGDVAVTVRQDGPLKATLKATRTGGSLTRV